MSGKKQQRAAKRAADAQRRGGMRRLRDSAPWIFVILVIAFVLWVVLDFTNVFSGP